MRYRRGTERTLMALGGGYEIQERDMADLNGSGRELCDTGERDRKDPNGSGRGYEIQERDRKNPNDSRRGYEVQGGY